MGLMDWIEERLGISQMRSEQSELHNQLQRWHNDMEARVKRLEAEVEVKRIGSSVEQHES